MFTYFLSVSSIAGFAIIWRNWINDHESWKDFIQNHFSVVGHAVLCGSCFTYWISLVFILLYNPIPNIFSMHQVLFMFFSWMSVAYGAVLLRFLYVLIQETVHYQVHQLRDDHHH